MTIVAVLGDCATTTSVALASAWPATDDVVLVETDPHGGSLAGWLDLPTAPSLSTAVTIGPTGDWPAVEASLHVTPAGVRVLPAPVRAVEASRAASEAATWVLPMLASKVDRVAIVDAGRISAAEALPASVAQSRVLVVVHRQVSHSARAEAVRLERAAELMAHLSGAGADVVIAVIGDRPFDPGEVVDFVADGVDAACVELPDDLFSASVLAGRTGVSRRRLARLPLARRARALAEVVRARTLPAPADSGAPA
jgi:MinD-like ATPase involved in chromosome partitioning or flagellar assembly